MEYKNIVSAEQLTKTSDSIKKDVVEMVFAGTENASSQVLLSSLTTPDIRKKFQNPKIVWKDGNFRFPHVNKATGVVALYNNPEVRELASHPKILSALRGAYGDTKIIFAHGPPAPIVKPPNAGRSAGFVYRFQDISKTEKHTAVLTVTDCDKKYGGLEELSGFDIYYDVLSAHYNFDRHCKSQDVLHLEDRWFSLPEANQLLEEYVAYYNYYERGIECSLNRSISWEAVDLYDQYKFFVPEDFRKLEWIQLSNDAGNLHIFSSKQALRTMNNTSKDFTRIYIQFAMQEIPPDWIGSTTQENLRQSFMTGKFGNWMQPGVRRFLRENSTEIAHRATNLSNQNFDIKQRELLGI